jgi:CRISPR-associated endonuclease Csn1
VKYKFNTAENRGTREEKKLKAYEWRSKAISEKLEKEEAAYVITEINNNLNNSSGYLGAISDRSKELYFNKETVGQYLYRQIQRNPHTSLSNQVFYRQDYLDEFEAIWNEQSKNHTELTNELKTEIRDIIIFYQRKLKSQKNLISLCEFENREIEIDKSGSKTKKTIGLKVAPKSSLLFQEFKTWQVLSNLLAKKKGSRRRVVSKVTDEKEVFEFDLQAKQQLFDELNIKGNITAGKAIELLGYKSSEWELNYTILEGNRTNKSLYEAYLKILDLEGYDVKDLLKIKLNKDDVELNDLDVPALEIKQMVKRIFEVLGINTDVLEFNAELDGKAFEQQLSYQLWHLLHAYEGDDSPSGNEKLYELLKKKFGFKTDHGRLLANVSLSDDYGSLSSKAMRKVYPFIKEHTYSEACELAGYKHSAASLTKAEIDNRPLKHKLDLLKKNSLRNPVVEKILNQMINVVNTLIETNSKKDKDGKITEYFKFDEIRIELARDLKRMLPSVPK